MAALGRAAWRIGIRGDPDRRRWFWRLLRIGMEKGVDTITRAVEFSIVGEHFVRYTAEEVLPRLQQRLAEIRAETAVPRERIARQGWVAAAPGWTDRCPTPRYHDGGGGTEAGIAAGPHP